ncbi:MAG: hypothetical protein R2726_11150 [Acidimicrobiales bacterium]
MVSPGSAPHARRHRAALVGAALAFAVAAGACSSSSTTAGGGPADESGAPAGTADTSPRRSTLAGVRVGLEPVAELTGAGTALAPRAGTANLYVTEQTGRVRELVADGSGGFTVAQNAVVDLSDDVAAGGERGLLGLTFSPDGSTLFVYYTAKDGAITVDAAHGGEPGVDLGAPQPAAARTPTLEPQRRGDHLRARRLLVRRHR